MSYLNCSLNFTFSSPPPQQPHSPFSHGCFLSRNLRSVGGPWPTEKLGLMLLLQCGFPPWPVPHKVRLLKMELGFRMFIISSFKNFWKGFCCESKAEDPNMAEAGHSQRFLQQSWWGLLPCLELPFSQRSSLCPCESSKPKYLPEGWELCFFLDTW